MTDRPCPMGTCPGCEYAKDCAHPETQARVLRAEVARLTGERDSAIEAYSRTLSLAATNGTLDAAETKARAEAAERALDSADCTHREGGDTRHCYIAAPCWRCRAEAAEKRVEELEARPDALTVAACSAEVCARLCALTERVTELEGALEAAADVIRDHLAESYPVVLDRADAALASGNGEAPAREVKP